MTIEMQLDAAAADILSRVTTATLSTVLPKKGLRNVWLRGARPLAPGRRMAGRAFTLRFVPAREDLATPESWSSPTSTRAAIENMPSGCIAVVDAMRAADDDGAIAIPAALLDDVLALAPEQERFEGWVMREVGMGVALPGLYPPNAETKARYEAEEKR